MARMTPRAVWTARPSWWRWCMSGAPSLRAIVKDLESHEERLSDLGCDPVRRSTLSEANRYRPAALFGDLLDVVMAQVHRGLRRHVKETTYLIDSTSVRLSALSGRWARFSATVCGAKHRLRSRRRP